ncbi:MAG: L,D-transpeptidase family protein [Alphaproteobacteria bacterium]|nr:L,D-transpeptidase family protein [Alphaproteobacteria bacterium]
MRVLIVTLCLLLSGVAVLRAAPVVTHADLIVVEKAKRSMTLYANKKPIKTYRIVLGGNPVGDKEQEGDSRTPEGRYIIDAKNPNSSFHLSLHVSYPDRQDRLAARRKGVSAGGAIMIHGSPDYIAALYATGIYPDWTAGCIAVSNAEIEEIFASVRVGTRIVITP